MEDYRKEKYWSKFANNFNEEQRYIVGGTIQQAILERLSGESGLGELIELGCGAGFYTKTLAANAGNVTATDLSDEMLAVSRNQLKDCQNVIIEKADCENTDFPDGKFNSIFMANLVHVLENPSIVLRESYRILK
ncbi:MAG: methyltransferase domain-containing protein, partial [Dehalococcoidia bacterium]